MRIFLRSLCAAILLMGSPAAQAAKPLVGQPAPDFELTLMKDKGLRVFAITTKDSVPIGRLKELFAVMRIPSARRIKGGYGPSKALPTNFVIDRAGKLRFAAAGVFDLEKLNEILVPLLNEPGD